MSKSEDGAEAALDVVSRIVDIYVETGESVPHDVYVAHEWLEEQVQELEHE